MIKIIKESKDEVINEDDDKSKPINIIYDIEVPVNISATEINLVKVLCYICDNTILAQNCDTLEELIESL